MQVHDLFKIMQNNTPNTPVFGWVICGNFLSWHQQTMQDQVAMSNIYLRPLRKDELGRYAEIGGRFFPHADWAGAPHRLGLMFDRWSEGILAVMDSEETILGYYTLWPITCESFQGFQTGSLKDEDMSSERMPSSPATPCGYWILTAIAVEPSGHELRKEVILMILSDLASRMKSNAPCTVIAHAATPEGHRFLNRTGFTIKNPEEPTVYTISTIDDQLR
jgi:hypothetical protein